ncbi:MAG TPA: MIP/aquaporin family protein, partial [Rhizomicrobium sp.]|jgi:glycerol uptake facilitator-like aquaporin
VVLVAIFGPVSGAHFNPAVTLYFALRREIAMPVAVLYVVTQIAGAIAGVWAAHLMFDAPLFEISHKARDGAGQAFSEFIATFGLMGTIAGAIRFRPSLTPVLVGLYISAAYWFTASTSFANPAVTLARAMSDSFAGIAPGSVPAFLVVQLAGAVTGWVIWGWMFGYSGEVAE